jgi:hypothetical protein
MAIVPLRQTVTITPAGGFDPDYNTPIPGEPYTLRCRFQEGVKLVRNQYGAEVVSVGTFYFDKLADIGLDAKLTYTNELGDATTYDPLTIGVKRMLSGRAILTEVGV